MSATALVWFKRDLRLHDHAPLAAAQLFEPALALCVIEPEWLQSPEGDPRHVAFSLGCVAELQTDLAAIGLPLIVRVGSDPASIPRTPIYAAMRPRSASTGA